MGRAGPGPFTKRNPACVARSEINLRPNNEDAFCTLEFKTSACGPRARFLAVADGMGGHAYGELASGEAVKRTAMAIIEQLAVAPSLNRPVGRTHDAEWRRSASEARLREALRAAFEVANAHVLRMAARGGWGTCGSTLVAAVVVRELAVVANVGDSPCFHWRAAERRLVRVTRDHNEAAALVANGFLTPDEALFHETKSVLVYFIGNEALPPGEFVHAVHFEPGDLLLLCTDGINGRLPHERLERLFAEDATDLGKLADRLREAARDLGENDNQTLILWRAPAEQRRRPRAGNQGGGEA